MNSNFTLEDSIDKKKQILNDLLNKMLQKNLKILENKNEEEQNNLKYIKTNIDNTLKTINFINKNLSSRQMYFTQRNSRDNLYFRSNINQFYKTKKNNNNNRIISYTPINIHNKNKFEIKKKKTNNNLNKINNTYHKRNLTPIPTKTFFKNSKKSNKINNLTCHVSFKSKITNKDINQNYSFIIPKNYNKKNLNILKTPEKKRKSHIINNDYNNHCKTSNNKKNTRNIINSSNNTNNNTINNSNNIINISNNTISNNNNTINNSDNNNNNNNLNKENNDFILNTEENLKVNIKTSNLFDLDDMNLNNDILLTNIDDDSLDLISLNPKESINTVLNFNKNNNDNNYFNNEENEIKKSNFNFLIIFNEQNISSTFLSFLSNSEIKNLLFINKKLGKIISDYLIDDVNTTILKKANYLNTEMKEIFERRQNINYNEIINKNPFHLSNNAFRALNLLNEEEYLSIFKNYLDRNNEKIYENEDVMKIFKLLFLILKKNPERKKIIEEFDNNNNNENNHLIWVNISNYILNEIKNYNNCLLGDYLKEEFNQIDLNIENLLKIEEFITPIFYIFNHLNFIKISSAVSFIVVALKDVIKYLEFPINQIEKLNAINVEVKNLKKITMNLENIKNKFFD